MKKYKVRLSNGKEYKVESKDFMECYNNALKGEENNVEIVLIEWIPNTFTEVERIILENTDEIYRYIARDEEGYLILFAGKPIKRKSIGEWETSYAEIWFGAFNHLFQNIKWEDEEPYKFR